MKRRENIFKTRLLTDRSEATPTTFLGQRQRNATPTLHAPCISLHVAPLRLQRIGNVSVGEGQSFGTDAEAAKDKERPSERSWNALSALPPWQLARTCMVVTLILGQLTSVFSHYVFDITWHRHG